MFNVEQLETVKEGATIQVLNALAKVSNSFLKLDVDKWARVVLSDGSVVIDSIKEDNDISAIEYEVVEISKGQPKQGGKSGKRSGKGDRKKGGDKAKQAASDAPQTQEETKQAPEE